MRRQMKKTYFTLLELMISMGVFAVLMLGLMQFFTSAQNLWTKSNSTTEVFDNARIAMNLLAADLATAYYEYGHDNQKMFMAKYSSPNIFAFATVRGTVANQNSVSRLTEVFYALDGTELKVRTVSDVDAAKANAKWVTKNITGGITNPGATAFFDSAITPSIFDLSTYCTIIPNVLAFDVLLLKKDQNPTDLFTEQFIKYPYMITITLTLIDSDTVLKLKALGEDTSAKLIALYGIYKSLPESDAKRILMEQGVQTFSRSIVIDRGHYD